MELKLTLRVTLNNLKKKVACSSLILLASLGLVTPNAIAAKDKISGSSESTSQNLVRNTLSVSEEKMVVVTDSSGVQTLMISPGETVAQTLRKHGLLIENFNDENGNPASDEKLTGDTIFLFRVEYKGSTQRMTLPAPVVKLRINGIPQGERIVQTPGTPGVGIMTTVKLQDLSSDKKVNANAEEGSSPRSTETFTVVKAPTPRVVLVSTNKLISENGDFTIPSGECGNGTSVPSTVTPDLIAMHRAVCILFPEISTYGTYRDSCTYSCDHRDGFAVDIMVSGSTGWAIATYLASMAETFNIYYLIYEQKIWTRSEPFWDPMEDRGSITANHFDHVHVSFNRDGLESAADHADHD